MVAVELAARLADMIGRAIGEHYGIGATAVGANHGRLVSRRPRFDPELSAASRFGIKSCVPGIPRPRNSPEFPDRPPTAPAPDGPDAPQDNTRYRVRSLPCARDASITCLLAVNSWSPGTVQ